MSGNRKSSASAIYRSERRASTLLVYIHIYIHIMLFAIICYGTKPVPGSIPLSMQLKKRPEAPKPTVLYSVVAEDRRAAVHVSSTMDF